MKKTAENATFFEIFEEFLMPIKAIIKHVSFPTNPSVSRKNLKKVPKKVLTEPRPRGIIYKSTRYGNKTKAKIARY